MYASCVENSCKCKAKYLVAPNNRIVTRRIAATRKLSNKEKHPYLGLELGAGCVQKLRDSSTGRRNEVGGCSQMNPLQ